MNFSTTLHFEPSILFNRIIVYMVVKWNLAKPHFLRVSLGFFGFFFLGIISKNANKRKDNQFEKNIVFVLCPKDHSTQKLGSYVKKSVPYRPFTDRRTDTQKDRVTNVDTLWGFQDFFPST